MISPMEGILQQLLVPDNDTIIQATDALRKALKDPDTILSLCGVMQNSEQMQIRQYAAVVLRKRFSKKKNWDKLPDQAKNSIKEGILTVLVNEKEKSVKTSVAQFIGAIAEHELQQNKWPQLLKFIHELSTSSDVNNVGLALFTVSVLSDIAVNVFAKNPEQLSFLLQHVFNALDDLSTVVGYYTVLTMTHTVGLCHADPQLRTIYSRAVPCVINGIRNLLTKDEEKAADCFQFFDEIMESATPLLTPHFASFLQFCVELAKNNTLDGSLRTKAINYIGWSSKLKPKMFVKLKIIKPVISVLFDVLCEPDENGEDDEDWNDSDDDETTPWKRATSAIAMMAMYLPPQKVLDAVMAHVDRGLNDSRVAMKRAAYLSLAVVTDGAAECIKKKYINQFFSCVRVGITDNSPFVRNAALYALGQFSEHLQPEISEHADEIIPILFEYLDHICKRLEKGTKVPQGVSNMFYALEVYCENLEEKLIPYLPNLVSKLLAVLDPAFPVEIQELAMSSLGSAALAVNSEFIPYFSAVIERLKYYLLEEHTEETSCLQVQSLDTLSVLTRTLGEKHMAPMATDIMQLGMKLLVSTEDPDLTRAAYSLFASLASVVKADSLAFLPKLMELLFISLKSTEGIVAEFGEDEEAAFPVYDDLSDSGEEDIAAESDASSDSGVQYSLENAYTAEKEEALIALKELALHAGPSFLPYVEKSFEESLKLILYPHEDIRKASIEALAQFCVCFSKINTPEGQQALIKSLAIVMEKCDELIHVDEDEDVVSGCLESLKLLLEDIGSPLIELGYRDIILKALISVLSNKTACQKKEEEEEEDGEEEVNDKSETLIETAGDVLPSLGKAMSASDFVALLQLVMPYIMPKLKDTGSLSQRSFFIGTLAECMSSAGPHLEQNQSICIELLSIFLPLSKDSDAEVRNNAIYGLGELVLHSKHQLFSKYGEILQYLSNALSREERPGTVDNICGALARLIISNVDIIPMGEVFPAILERLPLKDDFEEHNTIIKCFEHLYGRGHQILVEKISQIITICCIIVFEKKGSEEVLKSVAIFLNKCQNDFSSNFTAVISSLPTENALIIAEAIKSIGV